MRKQLFSVCIMAWLLCLGLLARGQTPITINGPSTVCKNSTWSYTVPSPTPGLSYQWTLTALGNLSTNYGSVTNVLWTSPGTTVLKVQGKNPSGTVIEQGLLNVTVLALPQPYITTDYRVACEHLPDPRKDQSAQQNQLFDDSGCVKVCEGSWVTYTAHGQPGSSFQWTISGGIAFPSGNTCLVHWGVPGQGSVTVKEVTSPGGCEGTRTVCIEIIGKPHAVFGTLPDTTLTNITVCNNETVMFIDRSYTTSASPIVSWYWDFGDGNSFGSSTGVNPSHTYHYDASGSNSYQVMLVVKNQCNCTDTAWMTVNVKDQDGVQIDCPGVVCEKGSGHYQLRDNIACGSYDWSVSGGTITSPMPYGDNIDVTWDNVDTSGFGYVSFDASSCAQSCPGVTTIKIPVIQSKGYISGPHIVCPNAAFLYHLPQWPGTLFNWSVTSSTGVTWNNTDQPNELVIHTNGADNIVIHCTYTNTLLGCSGKADLPVKVLPPVTVSGNTKVCVGSNGTYTLSGSTVGTWTLQQPNGTIVTGPVGNSYNASFTMAGTYTLAVSGNFCSPAPTVITAYAPPPAPDSLLGPDTVCAGVTYTFRAKNSQPGTLFQWSVPSGNGAFIGATTGSQVSIQFTGPGPYVVSVVRELSTDPHCTSAPLTKTIYAPQVHPHVTGPAVVCPNSYVNYTAGYNGGEIYHWSIVSPLAGSVASGDGTSAVQVLWNNTTVTVNALLIVEVTKCTIVKRDTLHVTIQPAPVMSLSVADSICRDAPLTVNLNIGGTGLSSANIHWDYGDLSSTNTVISSGPVFTTSTSHAYTALNNGNVKYTVAVTVTNPNGCTSTTVLSDTVIVKPAPVAFVTPVGPLVHCTTFSDPLTATLQAGFVPTNTLTWYKVPNLLQTSCGIPLPCSTFNATAYGQYYVVAAGQNGCTDTSNLVSEIQSCGGGGGGCTVIPTPVITVNHTQSCGSVTLNGTYSTGGYGDSWTWPVTAQGVTVVPSVGGSTLTAQFATAGLYAFSYNVTYTDNLGHPCVQSVADNVLVPLVPDLLWGVTCNTTGYNLTLLDHSNYYPGYAPTYFKFSIDGGYTGNNTAINSYTTTVLPGAHLLTLRVGNAHGDTCTISRNIFLDPLPVASFTAVSNFDCQGVPIHFNNTSTGSVSQLWDFGDLSQVTVNSPDRVYGVGGGPAFPVILKVVNSFGCQSTASQGISVSTNNLSGILTPVNPTICAGGTVNLVYTSTGGAPTTYTWKNDTSTFFVGMSNTLSVSDNGYYWVHVTDAHRCPYDTKPPTVVSVVNVPDAIISGDSLQCQGQTFTLHGYAGPDVVAYQWTRNMSAVGGNTADLDQSGLLPGTYDYQLTISVVNPAGGFCYRTSSVFRVTVFAPPARPVISYNAVNCATYQLQLSASIPGAGTFAWSNGMSGNPINVNIGGPYKVWFTDVHGCVSDTVADVPKDPKGYLWVFPEGCYSLCLPTGGFNIYGPIIPFAYWEWDMNYALYTSGTNSVVAPLNITSPGVFGLTLNNGLCQASSGNMYLSLLPNCGGGKYDCKQVDVKLSKINYDSDCNIFVTFNFNNTIGVNLPYTITTNMGGSVIPPSGTMTPGTSSTTVQWIPPSTFGGGAVTFTVTFILPDGTRCIREFEEQVQCGGPKVDCSMLAAKIAKVSYDQNCHVFVSFSIVNGSSVPLPYTIVPLSGGTMVPGAGTAAPGGITPITSQWIPPSTFGSGTAAFQVTFTLPDGTVCTYVLKTKIQCPTGGPVQRTIQTGEADAAEGNTLKLAPNPAQQSTEVVYSLGDTKAQHVLEVYDVTGRRLLQQQLPADAHGVQTLHVEGWVSGIYQVVLRSDGAAVATARLSVTH